MCFASSSMNAWRVSGFGNTPGPLSEAVSGAILEERKSQQVSSARNSLQSFASYKDEEKKSRCKCTELACIYNYTSKRNLLPEKSA